MADLIQNYKTTSHFDVEAYLDKNFKDPKGYPYVMEKLHAFWKQFPTTENLKLLEFGGGPNISKLVSACPYVEDIVFTEYVDFIRQAVQDWIDKKGYDWKATFDFIVQELEGLDEQASNDRQEELRRKLKALIPCDITADSPLDSSNLPVKLQPPYDVVFTSYCLEAVVQNKQEYKDAVTKLSKLVKPGGCLVMHGGIGYSFYTVGKYDFYAFKELTKDLILESLQNAGVTEVVFDMKMYAEKSHTFDGIGEFFVYGKLM